MKKSTLFAVLVAGVSGCFGVFARDVRVTDFGAKGDGVTKDTAALQRAIDAASASGGGRVTVPRGDYLTGTILLRNGITLDLEEGTTLKGSGNCADYLRGDVCQTMRNTRYFALVGAICVTNAAIVGKGTIDGQGHLFSREQKDRPSRIRTVVFWRSKDIRMEDVSIVRACRWTIFFRECENVLCRGLKLDCFAQNNSDGIDIEAKHVLIENCDLHCDDDAICPKSHNPDFIVEDVEVRNCRLASSCNLIKLGTASYGGFRNIRIHHCEIVPPRTTLRSENALRRIADRFSTEKGAWRRVPTIPGHYEPLSGISGIALEAVDGGFIEDVHIHDITMKGVRTPIFIRLGRRKVHPSGRPAYIRNVLIENVTGEATSKIANSITGVPGLRPRDITLRNIRLKQTGGGTKEDVGYPVPEVEAAYPECFMFDCQALPAWGFYLRHADAIRFENVKLECAAPDVRECYVEDDCTDVTVR